MKIVPSLCFSILLLAGVSSAAGSNHNPLAASAIDGSDAMQSVARAALSTSTGESPAQVRRTEERAREDREHTERRRSADEWRARGVETRGGDPRLRSDDLFFSDRDRARIAAIPLDQYPENVRVNIERIRNQPTGLENRTEGDDGLLPGFSRRLEPGQTLEGTVERLATVIPRGLRRRLPATPPDHEDILLEDRLIRVNRHSREIVDTVPVGPGRAVLRGS